MTPSAGSFRDQHSGITVDGDRVLRSFSPEGEAWFGEVEKRGLLASLITAGLLVDYETTSKSPLEVVTRRIPVVAYPYEWTASMFRDAALVTLDIALRAWDAGCHLRDASAFNLVFTDGRPVLVDLGSLRPGNPPYFYAFGQFAEHFLNPLALSATTGTAARMPWVTQEGLSGRDLVALSGTRLFRPGLIRYVWLPARLSARPDVAGADRRKELREDYGLSASAIRTMFERLRGVVEGFDLHPHGVWERYEESKSYSATEDAVKREVVRDVAQRIGTSRLAVDVGANTGSFSAELAPHFTTVVALEPDEAAADALYLAVRDGRVPANVRPMVADVLDPSPGRGFLNEERPSLLNRIAGADLVVWLAVLHHLVIGRNVPLQLFFEMCAAMGDLHLVEHVAPDDPMAELLLASREESPWPLDRRAFEEAAADLFVIQDTTVVSATRTLYELRRR